MADPLISETELGLAELTENDQQALDALFAPPPRSQEEEEIQFLSQTPSINLGQASAFIETRDDPKSIDILGGLATRLRDGKTPFNTQSLQDANKNIQDYFDLNNKAFEEAESKKDWLGMTKLALGGTGKVIGSFLQSGLGVTNEEAEASQRSLAARNYIGTIKDPEQAAKALELGALYEDELAAGKSIAPKDESPAMAFGAGPLTAKLGMNLAMAENYLRDLESDRSKKLGSASLRNFAIQSGDAFLPFVSIGDIVVDENDPDQVARRSALSNSINGIIQKDYMTGTLAGAALGSVGSFIGVGAGTTKFLNKAAQIAGQSIKVPAVLSRGATYATIGASQSFEGDPRDLSIAQRLSSVFSEAAVLGLAEGAGNKLEGSIDVALANHVAAKALATKLPALAPLVGSTGKVVGTTLGETASEEIEAILRGQDPIEPFLQNLAVSGGIGLGMAIPGLTSSVIASRRAKIYAMADDRFAKSLDQTVAGIKTDPNLNDQQKMEQIIQLRQSLSSPKAQALFDAINVRTSIDSITSPETAKVADEAVENSKQNAVESMLSAKLTEAEGRIGVAPILKEGPPETEEEKLSALNELVNVFEAGNTKIELANSPQNASKIQWLESQGRIVGELSTDGKVYSVTNVKTDSGNWLNGIPAIEFEQDLKDDFLLRAEQVGVEQEELDQMESELEQAGTPEDLESVARKYLGPTDYEIALESKLARSQDLVEVEKPAEINAKKLQDQINVLETKIKQAPVDEVPAMQEQLARLQAMQVEGQAARLVRGEESVSKLVQQFEGEVQAESREGKLAPELEARPDVILPINNPESESFQKYQKLNPDPREDAQNVLASVFNLKNPATVELLQSLGAIDENGRDLMTPAETLLAYVERKKSYLQSKSLAGYQKYNISDEVSSATINSFLYELRQGKNNLSLSTIFNSRLRDFIRRAVPRMRAGVGIGAAVSLETPGLRVNAVDAETLAEEQGLNPAVAGAINETLDQIDATEVDNQVVGQSEVPSPAQRQEALAVLAQQIVPSFRQTLTTEAEKLAFDALVSGKQITQQEAAGVQLPVGDIKVIQEVVRNRFISSLEGEYRKNQQAGTLPSRAVSEPEGLVREGNLTAAQIQPAAERFRKLQSDSFFDDEELAGAKSLLSEVQKVRSVKMLRAFENYIESIAQEKLSPEAITELSEAIDNNLKNAVEDDRLSQKQADDYIDKLNKLAEPYLASQTLEEGEAKNKIALTFRSNLLRVSDQILLDSGLNINEKGTYEESKKPEATKPDLKTTDGRREEARKKLSELEAKRAATTKRVPKETVPPERKEVGPAVTSGATGVGGLGAERARGIPIPKSFVESRNQLGKPYSEKVLDPIGSDTVRLLSPEQKQDVAASITTMESSKHKAFYLANGPGTGKTRVLLAAAKYYLNKGFNVFYLTAPDAVTPNWDLNTIGGSIEKDAGLMGVPIAARGGKGESGRGLPIENVPGKVVVSTYTSQYLEKILPLVDAKTVVIFDEQHSGRNLHKAIQEGKSRAWSILMNDISQKAGRVLMASGTPFETPDQLLSLGRLGIFDTESPDALIKRLGFEKQYLRGGKKSYWTLSPGVTETEMQDRLEAYLDGLVKNGILRSRSLKLDGVSVEFQDVPLDSAITKQLEDIKNMYGGTQNTDIASLRKLVSAQKRALEEYKVDAAAKRAIQSIRQGRKPVIYVGFVSETNARGEAVDPTSAAVEAAILRLAPDLRIARMYTGSGQTKEQALAAFNENAADVLIATKEMGGTGIELDDKFGDEPRDMIIMSPPVSAIQAVQLVYRVWRTDSASRPNLIFLESKAEVDQQNIDRMRAKLRLLDATTGAGFEGLKAEETKPAETVAPVKSTVGATPEQVSATDEILKSALGKDYNNNVITFRDAKGQAHNYNVKIDPTFTHSMAVVVGSDNDSDTIVVNPTLLEKGKKTLSPDAYKSYITQALLEETIHMETLRYYRELGLDPVEELTAIGDSLSQASRLAIGRLYYATLGSDITNSDTQGKIKALANDPYFVAMEGIRQLSQLKLTGGVTEQVNSVNANDIARATQRLKDILKSESKSVLARLGVWFDSMATVVKRGLGLAPNAKDRLVMRQSIEDAISTLRKTSKEFVQAGEAPARPIPAPGTSPTAPRAATVFDSYDLRIYRMIENHLEGRTEGVLGVTVADDLFKTVGVEEWLDALDINRRRGVITADERDLFRSATQAVMDGGRASLPAIANKALELAENMEEAGRSLPVAAFVATSAPTEVTSNEQSFEPQPAYQQYRVKIPGNIAVPTTASSEAKATANAVIRLFERQEVVNYNGQRYTSPGPLIAALRDAGYNKFAKVISPAPAVAMEKPIVNSVSLDGGPVLIPVPSPQVAQPVPVGSDLRKIKTNYENVENQLLGFPKEGSGKEGKGFDETKYPYSLQLEISSDNGNTWTSDAIRGMNFFQAVERAKRNWGPNVQLRSVNMVSPLVAPAPEIRESRAVKNIVTQFVDVLPEGKVKDKLLDAWYYQSVPREQQFADAKSYIATNGLQNSLNAFLSGNIKSSLPLQGAIGFELANALGAKAKTDLYAREQLAEVMLLLSRKYGTEPGRTVDLWNALGELSNNPEAMKMYINRQIDSSIRGRLTGFAEEESEISSGLVDSTRRAVDKLTTDKKTKSTIEKIAKLVELNKKQATVAELEAAVAEYVGSEQALADGAEFLGADLAAAPEVEGSDADGIRLNPEQTTALSRMILEIIQRSENPSVTAASEDQIKSLLMLTPALRDAKNQENVRRKLDLYFDAALTNALEIFSAQALGEARARESIQPPTTRGEAVRRVIDAKAKAKDQAPVAIPTEATSRLEALAEASAEALQKQAVRLQQEPKKKDQLEEFAARIRRLIAQRTKEQGGLQPTYTPEPKPTEAEVLRDRIEKYPDVMEFIDNVRDSLKEVYSEEELAGLEPFIDEAFGRPFTVSSLKQAVRSLESIGGPQTNIRGLIRSSKGDIMDFENKLGALLTQNTTLDEAQKKEVTDFLREGLTDLIAKERKLELERIKKRFDAKKERKTRKMRSALDRLIEATNLGVLNDSEVFAQMHSQLGLPELKEEERKKLNKLIEDLPLYPVGMIRNKKISEMYQYVKLVSPQVWGELLVNYQTSNLLAGIGTIGINAWSSTMSNQLNAGILAAVGAAKGIAGDKARAKAYKDAAIALNSAIFAGEKPALNAAANVFFNGDYSNIQDALTQELGGVNIWEAIVKQAEDYRAGKPGAVQPELPVNVFGQEYRIPLDSKFLSSKYGALAPFIFFGRSMAAGDAINKISSRKMYEIAEATNIAIAQGFQTNDEIEAEVARLLNQSPEARKRAEAKAASEAKEFNLTPEQESLRVEEILEQGRPDEEIVKNLTEKAKTFAAQSTFTNNFEGWFGLLADGLTSISAKAWPLRLFVKFLKTGSSLANEVLNFLPVMSTIRLYRGSAAMLKDTKYYRPPPVPGTVEHDLLLGKMALGYIITGTLLAALKDAIGGEDDPYFNIHFKGPADPAQREAFFAAGGKLRAIQIGRFSDGKPQFFSFEGFPVGLSGPLLLSGAITESIRYEKRSVAESIVLGGLTGSALAMYGILDMAALSGIRQLMSLTSPGVGQRDAKGIMTNLSKTVGNVAGGLIPGYATLRDVEQLFNGIAGSPSARPYQENLLSTFAQSIPFASKVGRPDLDFLGGNTKTQVANTVPFLRRLTTTGVDSQSYDDGDRTPQAIHDKLISMFASKRSSLDWDAGPLKDFAMLEMIQDAQAKGDQLTADDFYSLKRELSTDEKYEWMMRAGPIIQEQLSQLIPQLEQMSPGQFREVTRAVVNPIKKEILYQVLAEKNQEGILYPERQ